MQTGIRIAVPEPPKPIALPKEFAALVNITEVELQVKFRTFGNYVIPYCKPQQQTVVLIGGGFESFACDRGEEFAALQIGAARGVIDYGEKRRQEFPIHGREIALDLARECNSDIWGIGASVTGEELDGSAVRGFAGVFVADGAQPTDEELAQAKELLRLSDSALIFEGHATWDQFKAPNAIHAGFKRAARRWGVDAEWLYRVSNLPDCPHCGSKLKSLKATVCATCHRDVEPQNGSEREQDGELSAPKHRGGRAKKATV